MVGTLGGFLARTVCLPWVSSGQRSSFPQATASAAACAGKRWNMAKAGNPADRKRQAVYSDRRTWRLSPGVIHPQLACPGPAKHDATTEPVYCGSL
jgi:hypothetical protein